MRIEGGFTQVFGDGKPLAPAQKSGVRGYAWQRLPPDQQKLMAIKDHFVTVEPWKRIEFLPHGNDVKLAKVEIFFANGVSKQFDCWLTLYEFSFLPWKKYGWGANLPQYEPMVGYRLIQEGLIIHEARFESKQPAPTLKFKEVSRGEILLVKWVSEGVPEDRRAVRPCWVRYSLDGGLSWNPQRGDADQWRAGVSHPNWNDGGIELEKSVLDQNPHPLIELWITQGMTLTKLRYVVGEGGISLKH
ncbi:MAG: hypothetical protein IPL96_03220 [Holophagaceae bacterium]|nr:hypothetical protein [Holophagaceae bacterium]